MQHCIKKRHPGSPAQQSWRCFQCDLETDMAGMLISKINLGPEQHHLHGLVGSPPPLRAIF